MNKVFNPLQDALEAIDKLADKQIVEVERMRIEQKQKVIDAFRKARAK